MIENLVPKTQMDFAPIIIFEFCCVIEFRRTKIYLLKSREVLYYVKTVGCNFAFLEEGSKVFNHLLNNNN